MPVALVVSRSAPLPAPATSITWDQALAWRMRRHFLAASAASTSVSAVVDRLSGVQAQVASSADLAIRVRLEDPEPAVVAQAIADGRLFKTWAMRGTLHLLTANAARNVLPLMASGRSWERPSWQRYFGMSPMEMEQLRDVVYDVLGNGPLSRDELIATITARPGLAHIGEELASGWGTLLKPVAWHGLLAFGPNRGTRVTFMRTDQAAAGWTGLPSADEAAPRAIAAYLGAYAPSTAEAFSTWLAGGYFSRKQLRTWFASLDDVITGVDVDGERQFILREHLDELCSTEPTRDVRLLPGFDQWILGPTTRDVHVLEVARRSAVSRTAGWIAPIVVAGGRIRGTWEARNGSLAVEWFREGGKPPTKALEAETERMAALTGIALELSTAVV